MIYPLEDYREKLDLFLSNSNIYGKLHKKHQNFYFWIHRFISFLSILLICIVILFFVLEINYKKNIINLIILLVVIVLILIITYGKLESEYIRHKLSCQQYKDLVDYIQLNLK